MPTLLSRLREYRHGHGWTQEELAAKLGVTRQTIIAIEQGKYQPSLSLAWECAKLFNVKIEEIFSFS
jgi:putative transcriptional regulator